LENVIERLVVLADGNLIRATDLPDFLQPDDTPSGNFQIRLPAEGFSLEGLERDLILKALQRFDWNQSHAAKHLGLSRKTLIYRMEKFNLRREPAGDS
jgi:two-component system NtrC family response regulator